MFDVLVIGAGPAGAAAARLLAAWGHSVLVIDRGTSDAGFLAESIPPSANKILRAIGAIDAVQAAGFIPWRGNTVWWADESARVETFPEDAPGYQVLRSKFDRLLRALAHGAGARFEERSVTDAWVTEQARFVIDASGRAGVLARGARVIHHDRRTIALAGSWRSASPWPLDDASHTLVASYSGGWAWSVPVDPEIRQFTVMVDPARSELPRGIGSREVYLTEIAKVTPFANILAHADLIDAPWGADASEYTAREYARENVLLAGDAGSAINPLSSFGVKKALASGWLAAIAVHTALANPAMAAEAFAFFDRRERAVAASAMRQAALFANEAAERGGHPYWVARAGASALSVDDIDIDIEPDPSVLAREAGVQEAFADLRSREAVHLIPGSGMHIEPRPMIRGREIVREDQLVSKARPDGLRYLRGIDLVQVVRLAPAHRDVGELFDAVRSTSPDIQLPDFLGALSVLIANGALRHQ